MDFETLEKMGLDVTPLREGRRYVLGSDDGTQLDPFAIRKEMINDWVTKARQTKKPREQAQITLTEAVLERNITIPIYEGVRSLFRKEREAFLRTFRRPIEENTTLADAGYYCDYNELEEIVFMNMETLENSKIQRGEINNNRNGFIAIRKFQPEVYGEKIGIVSAEPSLKAIRQHAFHRATRKIGKKVERFKDAADDYVGVEGGKELWLATTALLGEVTSIPFLLPMNLVHGFQQNVLNKKSCLKKYDIEITFDPDQLLAAAKASDSCIKKKLPSYFESIMKDPGTIHLIGKQNGELASYARLLVCFDEKLEPTLCIDTIEPPRKSFHEYKGLINAFALASVQLGLDMNFKYVIGSDSRIKFGARQAFSNTERRLQLAKVGLMPEREEAFHFHYKNGALLTGNTDSYVLMQNWK